MCGKPRNASYCAGRNHAIRLDSFFPQCDAAAKVNTTTVFALVDIDRLLAVLDLLVAGTKEDCKYYRTLVGRAVRKLLACVTKDSMVAVPHKSLEGSE